MQNQSPSAVQVVRPKPRCLRDPFECLGDLDDECVASLGATLEVPVVRSVDFLPREGMY